MYTCNVVNVISVPGVKKQKTVSLEKMRSSVQYVASWAWIRAGPFRRSEVGDVMWGASAVNASRSSS